jgi:hypothetical protein
MFNISRRQILCASMLWLAGISRAMARSTKPLSLWLEVDLASRTNGIGSAIVQGVNEALLAKPALAQLIDLQIINHHGNPDRLMHQLGELVKTSDMKRVIGLIGGGDGNLAPVVARWAIGRQLPYFITWASNPRLIAQIQAEAQSQTYLLRKVVTDDEVFDQYLDALRQSGKKRWGLMLVNDALGRASYDYILESAMTSSSGLELVGIEWHGISATQIGLQYQALKQRGAQSIFMVTHPYAAQIFSRALSATVSASKSSRTGRQSIPIICSSNAWSPQLMKASQGAIVRAPMYFALPQNWQSSASMEPVAGFANMVAQDWFSTLAKTQQILRPVAGGLPLLAQILPLNTWQDKRLGMQLARYDPQGEIAFTDLSAVWDS